MKRKRLFAVGAAFAAVGVASAGTAVADYASVSDDQKAEQSVTQSLRNRHPKNVIFLLGDGMGTQEITAARYYQGVRNRLNVDRMPLTGFDTTWRVIHSDSLSIPPGVSA